MTHQRTMSSTSLRGGTHRLEAPSTARTRVRSLPQSTVSRSRPAALTWMVAAAATIFCLGASSARSATPLPVHRVALIVGANIGGEGRETLRYAQSDAQKMAAVLTEVGQVAPRDVIQLDQPTAAAVDVALDATQQALLRARDSGAHTEVVLYYSGHSDVEALLLGDERFSYRKLRQRVDALAADVRVVILDSCSSGGFTRPKGGTHRPAFLVDDEHRALGFAYLTSSAADEVAQESDRLQGSFFTHALVTGLRGAADLEHDGRVTLHEAYQFAYRSTLAQTETTIFGPQHAAYEMKLRGTGNIVMSDLSAANAQMVFAASLDGAVSLRNARGQLVAAFDKTPGKEIQLALGAGNYTVTLRNHAGVLVAKQTLDDGTAHITPFDFESVRAEPTVARGTGVSPLQASAASEIARVKQQARLREARLRYAAARIDVREADGSVGLFVGDSKVRIEGADFYERIGRDDLAARYLANSQAAQAFSLGGMAIELGGVFVAVGALAAAALIGTGPVAGLVFVGMAIGSAVLALTGASVASVGILSDPNPLSSRQSAELAREYNRGLRQRLGLRASDVDTGAHGGDLSPAPLATAPPPAL